MILRVRLEMLGEVSDAIREKCDLHFGRAGIAVMRAILGDQVRFLLFRGRQNPVLLNRFSVPFAVPMTAKSGTITAASRKNNPARVGLREAGQRDGDHRAAELTRNPLPASQSTRTLARGKSPFP